MKTVKLALVALMLTVFHCDVQGRTIKLLTIGNSFSEDAVEQYLYELAIEGGDRIIIGNAYRPGQSLEAHWNEAINGQALIEYRKIVNGQKTNQKGKTLAQCIADEAWDYISFQQASHYSGLAGTYEPYLSYLIGYVKAVCPNPSVKLGFHSTWAYSKDSTHGGYANYGNSQSAMYHAIRSVTAEVLGKHTGVISFVVPAGEAVQRVRSTSIGDTLCRDGYHLSLGTGRYTAACTWLVAITGQSLTGKKFRPKQVSNAEAEIIRQTVQELMQAPIAP